VIKLVRNPIEIKPLDRPCLRWEDYVKKYEKAIDPRTNRRGKQKTEREEENFFYRMVFKTGKPTKNSNTLR